MRKVLVILFFFAFCSTFMNAQFSITSQGFKNNNGGDYAVYEFPGKQKAELCQAASTSILKSMTGTLPSYYSNNEDFIVLTNKVRKLVYKGICGLTAEYILRFAIDDGKITVYAPKVDLSGIANGAEILLFLDAGKNWNGRHFHIFDKEGNLKEDEIKMKLENYFNEEIENLMQLNF